MSASDPVPLGASNAVTTIATTDLVEQAPAGPAPDERERQKEGEPLYPTGIPEPRGLVSPAAPVEGPGEAGGVAGGTGVDGEMVVWEATYSLRNFIGRVAVRVLLTIAWLIQAFYTWGMGHENQATLTWIVGAIIALFWVGLIVRLVQARYSHHYRLTNRRLFVSTGIFNRQRDMMELLSVKDVFTRQQSITDRWLGLGTVVVVPNEKETPTFYLPGVDDPKQVMDLIWHQARTERDRRTIKVDSV